ncbi:3-hydroxyacyl-CoA dehydrogenase family protein [Thermodesulfobacteriota bacterium]
MTEIKKIGVVGCGIMGGGITQVCAQSGYQVVVSETEDNLLKKGLSSIDKVLTRDVEKGKKSQEEKEDALKRIQGTLSLDDFSGCDLVIEAVPEVMELKKEIFEKLDKICSEHAILATNTSVLSVIDIAAATKRADMVIGMHFANPVPVMKVLEIVKTIATSDETLESAKSVGESLGKTVVVAKDEPGFLINRIFTPLLLNAVRILEAGSATREDIDTIVKEGLGHPMGPLTLLDLIGIDTVYRGEMDMYEETKDSQYNPPTLMRKMVAMGWHGRKSGKGFYDYS